MFELLAPVFKPLKKRNEMIVENQDNLDHWSSALSEMDALSLFEFVNNSILRDVLCELPFDIKMLHPDLHNEIVNAFNGVLGEGESVKTYYLISESLGNNLSRYAPGECLYRFDNCTYLWGYKSDGFMFDYDVLRQVCFLAGMY